MKIVITGATGFIGKALCRELVKEHNVIALTRRPSQARDILPDTVEIVKWDANSPGDWTNYLENSDAIVNLGGANLASGRWTKKLKDEIYNSRIKSYRVLIEAIKNLKVKPHTVIISSAIGFYGSRGDEQLDEKSVRGNGFLADVCYEVEKFSKQIENMDIKAVVIRTGIVLDRSGGALERFIKIFEWYIGSIIGNGKQWISWISLYDEIAAIKFLIENNLKGVFNLVSPQPLQNRDFFQILAVCLKKPCWFRTPGFLLKVILGKIANELFLSSQRVYPNRLIKEGFVFKYPNLNEAIKK